MASVRKFLRLPPTQRRLLIQAILLLGAVRLGLWVLPFGTLQRMLSRISPRGHRVSLENVTWAVRAASRHGPWATCLTQALTTQVLLRRHGHPATLRIGVASGDDRQLQAHAWVESGGRIVLGGNADLARYTPLPPLEGKRL